MTMLSALVLLPLLAAAALPAIRNSGGQNALAITTVVLVLAGLLVLAPTVIQGQILIGSLPGLLGRFHFQADPFGLLFALVGTLVWLSAVVYATGYLGDDPHRRRFLSVCLVLLATNLGVVLAADLLTLFVFFELLGLVAVLVVVHSGSQEARSAGITYFWMTLAGGIALLAGVMAIQAQAGSLAWQPLPEAVGAGWRWSIFALLLVGFGVKAGMVPLHIWLPAAHPVAPAPASALLSGVIIKAGAYGLFRCLNMLMAPTPETQAWGETVDMGLLLTLLGITTLLIGVVLALGQHSAKRMLAWHSVSQMGFVLTGLGVGAFLAADGAMATAGALLHVVNHALFKSCLFLGAGAVALRAGTADMYRLGGLWRGMPVTFACMLVAAAGIAGVPLFNGFVSKCMIHHGLVEASQREGGQILVYAEWLYMAACAGTVASFIKFIGLIFLRKPQQPKRVREVQPALLVGMLMPVVPIIWLGWRPHELLGSVIAPALADWGVSAQPITYYLEHYFMSGQDLIASAGTLAGGVAVFVAGMKFGWFNLQLPQAVGVAWWYRKLGTGLVNLCLQLSCLAATARAAAPGTVRRLYRRLCRALRRDVDGLTRPGTHEPYEDRLFEALDQQRDRLLVAADRLAQKHKDQYPGDALINGTHLIAGWLGTELVQRAMAGDRRSQRLGRDEAFCQKLASRAVEVAQKQLDAGLDGSEMQEILAELEAALGTESDHPDHNWPERSWPAELAAVVLAPDRAHWPVSERLAQGALVRAARGRVRKVARDLSSGLLIAFVILLCLALALRLLKLPMP
ncbi:complex I subunit 5 family protein [Wenzhouxiangella limi]|uniref:NADH dehydrogenase n=1 Tax=Wenzhouxiangella limi TaxID=2707351 RepID=A0A845UVE5_9GAMM|nr:complex I subunit 5 family protein [Wenzhouxiangella limi]NDY94182.1 NADH dehydrogenase [Wenzhouxiangella limi]